MRRPTWIAVCTVALLAVVATAARADVHVALLPADFQVQESDVFDLQLEVTEAGSAFNGYDITIEFDPSHLAFVPRPLGQQEGALMTGACSNRFQSFHENNGVITLTHSLLCSGVSVTGPGVLYKLRFQAGALPAVTQVHIASVRFANAGILVEPVHPADATVHIGTVTAVPPDELDSNRSVLRPPYPNPFHASVQLSFTAARDGRTRLDVFSVSGRPVRQLADAEMSAGTVRTLTWDGRNDAGHPVPPGVYWIRLSASDGPRSLRLIKVR